MSVLLLFLLLVGGAEALIYVRTRGNQHLGCAEKTLQPFEHLLLPRALQCTEKQCTDEGSIVLGVHSLTCTDVDSCSAQLLCRSRLPEVYAGLAVTFVGFFAVLAFACAPVLRPGAPIKLHKT